MFEQTKSLRGKSSQILSSLGVLALVAIPIQEAMAEIEEVVVTAQKRNENLQDVPIAVSALNSDDIEKFQLDQVTDLRGTVSGLEIRQALGIGAPSMTIRGIGSTTFDSVSGPVVTTIIDDIPSVSVGQLNFQMFDLESIEVLKGPQGTIFGAGTTAGVIQMQSKKPSQEFEAEISAGFGDYGESSVEAVIGGGISDNWSSRLSVRTSEFDGVYDNTLTGRNGRS